MRRGRAPGSDSSAWCRLDGAGSRGARASESYAIVPPPRTSVSGRAQRRTGEGASQTPTRHSARPADGFHRPVPSWHSYGVTDADPIDWLTVPDLVELLGQSPSRIRRLIDERYLLAARVDGVLKVPALFLRDAAPLPELHGTAIVLADAGFTDAEALEWLIGVDDSLGTTPIEALRAGRKSEVRRVAQALA